MNRDELLETGDRLLVIAATVAEDLHPALVMDEPELQARASDAIAASAELRLLGECAALLARMAEAARDCE